MQLERGISFLNKGQLTNKYLDRWVNLNVDTDKQQWDTICCRPNTVL